MSRKIFILSILTLIFQLFIYVYVPTRFSILLLAFMMLLISIVSFELIKKASNSEDQNFIIWTNNFLIVFLAALMGILISLEINKVKELSNEKQNYNKKIILFEIEVQKNRYIFDYFKKHQIYYERNGKTYQQIPMNRAETKFGNLLLSDTNCSKFIDEGSIMLISNYIFGVDAFNKELEYDIKRIEEGKFNNQDKDSYYGDINESLDEATLMLNLLERIIRENKSNLAFDKRSKDLLDIYGENVKKVEEKYTKMTHPLEEIK